MESGAAIRPEPGASVPPGVVAPVFCEVDRGETACRSRSLAQVLGDTENPVSKCVQFVVAMTKAVSITRGIWPAWVS